MKSLFATTGIIAFFSTCCAYIYHIYCAARNLRLSEMEETAQVADTDFGMIEYKLVGEDDPVIMVLHGMLGTYQQAFDEFTFVLEHGFRLLAISRPGYASSEGNPTKPEEHAEYYKQLLDHLEIEEVIVVAISAGGSTGLEFARLYKTRCKALVTLAPAVQPLGEDKQRLTRLMDAILHLPANDFVSWCLTKVMILALPIGARMSPMIPDDLITDEKIYQQHVKWVKGFFPVSMRVKGFENDIRLLANLSLQHLSEVNVPVLLLHGVADQVVPVAHSSFLNDNLVNAHHHVVQNDAGHTFYITHREEVWHQISTFIASAV